MKVPEFELLVCLFAAMDDKGRTTLFDNMSDHLDWMDCLNLETTVEDLVERYQHLSAINIIKKWEVEV